MKEKLVKKVHPFNFYELRVLEEYLEEMATAGFMLVKQKGVIFYFRKCEPKKMKFFVDIFGKASIFDTRPEGDVGEYIEYCKAADWQFVCTNGKMQYFCSEKLDNVPIETDDKNRLKMLHRQTLTQNGILWAIMLYMLWITISQMLETDLVGALIENGNVFLTIILLNVFNVIDVAQYLRFYIGNRRRVANGNGLRFSTRKSVEKFQGIRIGILMFWFLIYVGMLFFGGGKIEKIVAIVVIVAWIGTFVVEYFRQGNEKLSRVHNMALIFASTAVSMVFVCGIMVMLFATMLGGDVVKYYDKEEEAYVWQSIDQDEIPVTIEKIGELPKKTVHNSTSAYEYYSVFGTSLGYEQILYTDDMKDNGYLEYDIIRSPIQAILEDYIREIMTWEWVEARDITKEEAALWGAERVYEIKDKEDGTVCGRLVRYSRYVLWMTNNQFTYDQSTIPDIVKAIEK